MLKRSYFTKQRRGLTFAQKRRLANQAIRQLRLSLWHNRLHKHATKCVGIYVDGFGEMPTQPLLTWAKKNGKHVYVPVVSRFHSRKTGLRFAKLTTTKLVTARLAYHPLGMKQPATTPTLAAYQLDVLFMPLVAADKQGNRMGMGGGFYDKTLAHCPKKPLRLGWAYDFQVVKKLPTQPWDKKLHALITPSQVYYFSRCSKID